jgi:hypothetical protein
MTASATWSRGASVRCLMLRSLCTLGLGLGAALSPTQNGPLGGSQVASQKTGLGPDKSSYLNLRIGWKQNHVLGCGYAGALVVPAVHFCGANKRQRIAEVMYPSSSVAGNLSSTPTGHVAKCDVPVAPGSRGTPSTLSLIAFRIGLDDAEFYELSDRIG